ncbi:MAG: metal-dependent transcriptional regulator [Candidatus Hadarchaeales archaeon]
MGVIQLTENEVKYLKEIYRRRCEDFQSVRTSQLAKSLGVNPATVTEVIQSLSRKNLLKYRRYREVKLTMAGIREARKLLRKHRLLEILFVGQLGCDVRTACKEASKLDYRVSMEIVNAICRLNNHPTVCPCGKEIFEDSRCRRISK